MVGLTGIRKIKTAIFISGNGSNMKNLIKFSKLRSSPIYVDLILSSNKKAKGIRYSNKSKIVSKIFNFKNERDEEKILEILKKRKIHLICLAGFMKILSKDFIKKFKGNILNIHPSLLPKYKGINTHERVIINNEKFSGCTVHLVNSKLDSGKIILQKEVRINKKDNPKTLSKKILKQEHILYPKAIKKFLSRT
ncbi:phosphoribosylglycinamide formyltransferase [Candidatus Pelagibacter sp.]|nr:phosphoribosylglycinamide formyltransferase [Candidatus Pelagibacter sp.]